MLAVDAEPSRITGSRRLQENTCSTASGLSLTQGGGACGRPAPCPHGYTELSRMTYCRKRGCQRAKV